MSDRKIILVVDDMAENLTLMRSILMEDYDVRLAKSGKMALNVLNDLKVDLILLDIEMPVMSGFDFVKRLHAEDSLNKDTPVIFVTSKADKEIITWALDSGAKDYILKPVNAKSLHNKIETVLGKFVNITNPLEEKLKSLLAYAASGDSGLAEITVKEIIAMTKDGNERVHNHIESISKLIKSFDYEKAIIKIKESLHNLSINRW